MATLDTSSLGLEEFLTAAMLLRNDGDLHTQLAAQAELEGRADSLDRVRYYTNDRYNTAHKFEVLRTSALSNGDMILVANLLRRQVDNYTEMAQEVSNAGRSELANHYHNEAARYQRHLDKFVAIINDYDEQIKKEFGI